MVVCARFLQLFVNCVWMAAWSNTPQQSYFLLVRRVIFYVAVRTFVLRRIYIYFLFQFFLHRCTRYSGFFCLFKIVAAQNRERPYRWMNAKRFNSKSGRLNVHAIILGGICFIFYCTLVLFLLLSSSSPACSSHCFCLYPTQCTITEYAI